MVKLLENIVNTCNGLKEEISQIRQGYIFAKQLTKDVKNRTTLILAGRSTTLVDLGLVFQLVEYQFAKDDIQNNFINPYSTGIMLYGYMHKKDHKLLDGMYRHLGSARNDEILSIDFIE